MLAGALIENEDIGASAAINPLKMEKRIIKIPCYITNCASSGGAGSTNYLISFSNAAVGQANLSLVLPRAEIAQGEKGTLRILWYTSAGSGNVRLVVDVKPIIEGTANLSSAIQKAVVTAAGAVYTLVESKIEIPYAILSNSQALGIQIYRDPDNALDTLAQSCCITSIQLEVLGRC
jgi:hypothetical protein